MTRETMTTSMVDRAPYAETEQQDSEERSTRIRQGLSRRADLGMSLHADASHETQQATDFEFNFSSPEGTRAIIRRLAGEHAAKKGEKHIAPQQFLREYTTEINAYSTIDRSRSYTESLPYIKEIADHRRDALRELREGSGDTKQLTQVKTEADLFMSIMQLPFIVQQKRLGKKEGLTRYFTDFQVKLYDYVEAHPDVGMRTFRDMLKEFNFSSGVQEELEGAISGAAGELAVHGATEGMFRRATVEEDRRGDDFMRIGDEGYFEGINVKCKKQLDKAAFARDNTRLYLYIPQRAIANNWRLEPEYTAKLSHALQTIQGWPADEVLAKIPSVR